MPFDLTPLFPSLSPEDTLCAQEALWGLLKQQARLYAPDSTSLPAETAATLAESILLTLGADRNPAVLLSVDLHAAFRQGQRRLSQKLTLSQHLLQAALASRPQAENRSLSDTLSSLKSFSKRWDFHFFAQEIPCDIDYQLSQPVSEALRGVDYVNEWLRRLCLEQAFLDCFDPVLIRTVLEQSCPDYRNLLINLYEPVAVNALGLAILGDDPRTLSIPASRWQKLENCLTGLSRKTLADTLSAGATALCSALELPPALLRHTQTTAQNLLPRLRAALQGGNNRTPVSLPVEIDRRQKRRLKTGAAFYCKRQKRKIVQLALLTHLGEALAAIDRTVGLGLKGNLGLAAAGCTNSGEILAGTAGSVLASVTAGLAALGLVLEAALSIELLLTSGEHELLATLFAH